MNPSPRRIKTAFHFSDSLEHRFSAYAMAAIAAGASMLGLARRKRNGAVAFPPCQP